MEFDVIEETLDKTNLKNICKSSKVNLERSMTAKTEIGGHLVSGHIHGAYCASNSITPIPWNSSGVGIKGIKNTKSST